MPFGFLSGVANIMATDSTNTTNKGINREQLKAQQEENQKQRDYDWNKMVAEQDWQQKMYEQYNTPSAMKQQYREAGINPFIQGSNAIGSGISDTSPSGGAPAVGSVPSPIPMQSPNLGGIDAFADFLLNKKKVDADAANQSSQMFKTLIDGVVTLAKGGHRQAANELWNYLAPQISGFEASQDKFSQMYDKEIYKIDLDNSIREVEKQVSQEVGLANAQQVLRNMQMEYTRSQKEIDLWDNIKKLNDATVNLRRAQTNSEWKLAKKYEEEVFVLRAQVKELQSRSYMEFAYGCLADEKSLTEGTLRKYWESQQKYKALTMGIDYENLAADFESEDWQRDVKKSWFGKFHKAWNFGVDEAIGKPVKSFVDIFSDLPKLSKPRLKRVHHQNYLNPQGYKSYVEDYSYE